MTDQAKSRRKIMPKADRDRQWLWVKSLQDGEHVKHTQSGHVYTVKIGEASNSLSLPPVLLVDESGKSQKIMRQELVVSWEAA